MYMDHTPPSPEIMQQIERINAPIIAARNAYPDRHMSAMARAKFEDLPSDVQADIERMRGSKNSRNEPALESIARNVVQSFNKESGE